VDGRDVLRWCRSRAGATEEFPFGPETCFFKVGGRMFAACPSGEAPDRISLKCEPERAERLRAEHPGIRPAHHMNQTNRRFWNSVPLDGSVPSDLLADLLDLSYALVVASLPRRVRDGIG
jgi:predicted DNA-binding protein (MmcQ/YjbR family)